MPRFGGKNLQGRPFTRVVAASNSLNINSADYVCDGVADEVEINQAITDVNNAGGGIVHLLAGTFTVVASVVVAGEANTALRLYSGVTLQGEGKEATIINAPTLTGGASSQRVIVAIGSITTLGGLGVAATSTGQPIIVAAGTGALYAAGDLIRLLSTDAWYSSDGTRGELHKVVSRSGDNVTLDTAIMDDTTTGYTVANTTITRITPVIGIVIRDLRINGPNDGLNGVGISVTYAEDFTVVNVHIRGCASRAIAAEVSFKVLVDNCHLENSNRAELGYGTSFANTTQYVNVTNCHFHNNRHHGAGGGGSGVGRFFTWANNTCTWARDATETFDVMFRGHTNTDYMTFSGNYVSSQLGVTVFQLCRNGVVIGNTVDGGANLVTSDLREMKKIVIANNSMHNIYRSVFSTGGVAPGIDLPELELTVIGNTMEDGVNSGPQAALLIETSWRRLVIVGNRLGSSVDRCIAVTAAATTTGPVLIANNELRSGGAGNQCIFIQTNGDALADGIEITGNYITSGSKGVDVFAGNGNISRVSITNNFFDTITGEAVHIRNDVGNLFSVQYIVVNSNLMRVAAGMTYGIRTEGNSDIHTVVGNAIHGATVAAIAVANQGANDVVANNNTA